MQIKTLLIANRGEIACRIARAARACGIIPVGVHSDADKNAKHVKEIGQSIRLGPGPAIDSYLNINAVLAAARLSGADAIHPGYGFLAENPEFARAVNDNGMIFVGPTPDTLEQFGDKSLAKKAAVAACVPVIPGSENSFNNVSEIAQEVQKMGLPVLLKAVGGGGGRGQRLVNDETTLEKDIEATLREAKSSFNSDGLLLERMIIGARHVEIQIVGDGKGNVVHFYERDCSLQRRHQKVIEEAPAFGLPRDLLDKMANDAVNLGRSLNFRGLGTVEFLVSENEFFFLEVNPRLQVEHPVTEAVTGVDLVQLHLNIAAGNELDLVQSDIHLNGHAFEARIYAEDPSNNFAPSTGQIQSIHFPEDARIESGVDAGDNISPFYDPMIAKVITVGKNRSDALIQLQNALKKTSVLGVDSNLEFLKNLTTCADVENMSLHTRWIDDNIGLLTYTDDIDGSEILAIGSAIWSQCFRANQAKNPWQRRDTFTGWRLKLGDAAPKYNPLLKISYKGKTRPVSISPMNEQGDVTVIIGDSKAFTLNLTQLSETSWHIDISGRETLFSVYTSENTISMCGPVNSHILTIGPILSHTSTQGADNGTLQSPLTGLIVALPISVGDVVPAGGTIATLESMKMEIPIKAVNEGIVTSIMTNLGDMVERGQTIAEITHKNEV